MTLHHLNKICFTICIVCIVCGTVLSLAMIWGEFQDKDVLWKSWLTIGVLFLSVGPDLGREHDIRPNLELSPSSVNSVCSVVIPLQ